MIGDDPVMDGPYGPRRVTYADYTATGRALAFSRTSSATRCCPATPTRTPRLAAPGCRRRVCARTRGGSSAMRSAATTTTLVIFTGSGTTGAVDKLVRILDVCRQSAVPPGRATTPVVFVGPFEHHSNELPWRESIADVVQHPRGLRRPSRPGYARTGLLRVRRPAAADRLVLGRVQRYRHRHRHDPRHPAAPRARRALLLGLRRGRAVRRHHMCPAAEPLAYKDAVFLSPHKLIGGPGRRGFSSYDASWCTNRGAYGARRRHRRLRQPVRAPSTSTDPIAPRGGRHAGHRRVDPRRPGLPAQGGRRRAVIRAARRRCCVAP